jgi:molybdopterin/thiamine biosynthesis adenylyltransferase
MGPYTLSLPGHLAKTLGAHLFPADRDEHAAIIGAGLAETPGGTILLARDVILARDGIDYVPGQRGYRMLTGQFVTEQILRCRAAGLVYLAIHNHGGDDRVDFSEDDLASQQRGYPALLDILEGPVGALVFASNAMAGRLWLAADRVEEILEARVLDTSIQWLRPAPRSVSRRRAAAYDRQARLFGDRGQDLLSRLTVGIIGAGGAGSLLVEYLARLGIGRFVIIDPERLDPTNVPRVTGATSWDAMTLLRNESLPGWIQRLGERLATPKVRLMRRLIRRANPSARVVTLKADFVDDPIARQVLGCDYLFLAADSMQARLVFNAIVHAYLIPGVQVGAKIPVDKETGEVGSVFATSRIVTPSAGCLWCNGLITRAGLQREAETQAERRAQRYVDEPGVVAPSVITLNAKAAAQAANDFLFTVTGLVDDGARADYVRYIPRERAVKYERPRRDPECPHCGAGPESLFARGDAATLPTRGSPIP